MGRRPTRRQPSRGRSGAASNFGGEEEDGYGSGDYDEGFELVRIKVKVRHFFTPVSICAHVVLDSLQRRGARHGTHAGRVV